MLTSKQRAALRSMSNPITAVFQVGKGGVSDEMCRQIDAALEARELIKISCLENSGYTAREAAEEIADRTASDVVTVIGSKFVLYRRSSEKPKIELV